jgi:hypothetical protein
MNKSIRIAAIVLLFIDAVSAIYGGGSLVYDPSGEFLQLPIKLLNNTPFKNFLIPGIILFSVNGIFNLIVGILGILNHKLFPNLTISCGLLLIGWLTIQIVIIKQFYAPAHLPYYVIGIILIILGLILRNQMRKQI